jgi:hypothetical protein
LSIGIETQIPNPKCLTKLVEVIATPCLANTGRTVIELDSPAIPAKVPASDDVYPGLLKINRREDWIT